METYLQELGMEISLEASKIKGFGRNKANEVQARIEINRGDARGLKFAVGWMQPYSRPDLLGVWIASKVIVVREILLTGSLFHEGQGGHTHS